MVDQMFSDPNLIVAAEYASPSVGSRSVRVMVRQPDQISDFMQVKAVIGSLVADISASQIDNPQEDDILIIRGKAYQIKQVEKDSLGLIWKLQLREAA